MILKLIKIEDQGLKQVLKESQHPIKSKSPTFL